MKGPVPCTPERGRQPAAPPGEPTGLRDPRATPPCVGSGPPNKDPAGAGRPSAPATRTPWRPGSPKMWLSPDSPTPPWQWQPLGRDLPAPRYPLSPEPRLSCTPAQAPGRGQKRSRPGPGTGGGLREPVCVLQDALQHHSGTVFPPHVPQQETARHEQTQFWVFLPAAGNARSGCRSRGRGGGGSASGDKGSTRTRQVLPSPSHLVLEPVPPSPHMQVPGGAVVETAVTQPAVEPDHLALVVTHL